MVEFLVCMLGACLVLYSVFGGADFGAGILELFKGNSRKDDQVKLITQAMGPVWEANHMWLIIAVVVMFNGFPRAYADFSILFHVPLTAMLVGIILRGCAFTFRHYDAYQDQWQNIYSLLFAVSSAITPLMMGMMAGACLLGKFQAPGTASYWMTYIAPWLNVFCVSVGVFVCCLFTFLAAVYLNAEAGDEELQEIFKNRAKAANIACILSGALVFFSAEWEGIALLQDFISHPLSFLSIVLATILLIPLWFGVWEHDRSLIRFLAAGQVTLVLLGYFRLMYPNLIRVRSNTEMIDIDFYRTAAGPETLVYLVWALVLGLFLILPALAYLFYVFKSETFFDSKK
ncbi:MAG: cytochrome d ubiquinol oxidase subunit 2 [Waddliaceae bacterium]|nr:cytochrome d ubiquinol oxidase subunit 2 [Waddliaceae bacterium]